ncbi:DUF861 domain-containing protein [Bradyrhizobium sp. SRL28]|uniref:cupin domain-containing protein n=1 Tax=Bradyrhizobium sp. SRL28 TaxID=2836178 RepID=UPI001BDEF22F|nr:cupin domain-containing protein [Bradyrhizobium sp. SRL28]MBT1516780.1 DUF861 domain-containing protein [Bradyrhizobium sp. SRL28]
MTITKLPEVLHLKSEDMSFPANIQSHALKQHPGGYASNLRLVTPEISKTFAAGIGVYERCSFEMTTKYDEAIIVLDGLLRVYTGENHSRVIEARAGDVLWIVKGIPMKWEFDKLTKIFYAAHPVDWRPRGEAEAIVDVATDHFRDESVRDELVTRGKVENWFPYELKMFLDLIIAQSGDRKLRVKDVRVPPNWFTAVVPAGDAARSGT